MQLYTVSEWVNWINSLDDGKICLGLDRVKAAAKDLNITNPSCPVIVVGGTNGKGSTVSGLEAIYLAAGYTVGSFTSPFLLNYNEQVRVNGNAMRDDVFFQAFARVAEIINHIPLTAFEFHTLAAFLILQKFNLNVWILEVGLGGRLDSVNIINADIAIVTSIALDHTHWLGNTREKIAIEKAGIFRPNKPAICGDSAPPITLLEAAKRINAPLYIQDKNFYYKKSKTTWSWYVEKLVYRDLPLPTLALQNMSTVLMAIHLLQNKLPVKKNAIASGLKNVKLAGRVQVIEDDVVKILDVSHNPAAITYLSQRLQELSCSGKTYAIFSMLGDKDIINSIHAIKHQITAWYVAPVVAKRTASIAQLQFAFTQAQILNVQYFNSILDAYHSIEKIAHPGDRIVIFGSFHTVAEWYTKNSGSSLTTYCSS